MIHARELSFRRPATAPLVSLPFPSPRSSFPGDILYDLVRLQDWREAVTDAMGEAKLGIGRWEEMAAHDLRGAKVGV